uniref:hypothetical protein n=1 Tax=Gimesia maris TaxID=122 RepID=UPI0024202EBA
GEQKTDRAIAQSRHAHQTGLTVRVGSIYPPARRISNQFHTAMGTDGNLALELSTTKNTKRLEIKNG